MSDRSSLRSVRARGLRGWGPRDREGLVAAVAMTGMVAVVAMTGHIASAIIKQREMDAGAHASSFSLRTSALGMALPVCRVGLPSAVNLSVNTPKDTPKGAAPARGVHTQRWSQFLQVDLAVPESAHYKPAVPSRSLKMCFHPAKRWTGSKGFRGR